MTDPKVIDGKAIGDRLRSELAAEVASLKERTGRVPGLAAVLVGEDPASQVYVRNKRLACDKAGIYSELHQLPATTTQAQLLDLVRRLNAQASINGILVQLPLPKGLDEDGVIETISPDKDVDGFHAFNVGRLMLGRPTFRSATPWGVMKLLEHAGVDPAGKEAVIVGRSNIVGKPMALMLLAAHATVTVCHSRTRDLSDVVRRGDIVIAAAGKAGLVTGAMLKPGAVVIDVGTNRNSEGKLVGDVDFASALPVASRISPVPGGVGPMTITMLLYNTLLSFRRAKGLQ